MPALKKHLRLYRLIAVVIHLVVYLPFFAVQFLYNFDIASHTRLEGSLKVSPDVSSHYVQHVKGLGENTGQQPVKAKIRLSKRFQPESIIAFSIYHTTPIIHWVTFFKPRPVNTQLHLVLLSFNQPLRGPPSFQYIFS